MEDNSSNSDDVIELDSLKKFTIPKRVKKTRELFEPTSTNSREFQHEILPIIQSSFKDRGSVKNFTYSGANIIHNLQLQNSYLERRKSMRADGYSEKEVQDSYAFLAVDTLDKARKICLDGLRVGNSKVSCLGNPDMAVCLCKHADLLRPMPFTHGQCCRLLIFKVIKGKVKTMMECRGSTEPLDPTPHYDCHISKTANVDLTCTPLSIAFESTQLFLYEYGDYDLEEQPRQILPYAMVEFRYLGDPRHRPSAAPKHTASWAGSIRPLKSPGSTGPRLPTSSVPPTLHSPTMPNLPLRSLLPTPSHPPPIPGPPPSPIRPPSSSMYMPLASPITPTNTPSPQPPSPLEDPAQRPSYSSDYLKPVVTNIGKRRDGGGVVVWVGKLSSHGTQICDVELVSFMGNVRPACIGMQLNVSKRYTLEAVRSKLLAGCVNMSRDVETCQQNHFYNYCMLKPAGQAHLSQFNHIVSYLDRRRLGACVTLEEKSEVLLLSDSELTQQLGLGEFSKDRLHCIFISNKSRQGRILVDTPPQSVRSDTPESQGNAQAVDKLSLLQALGQGVAESNPAAPRRFSSSSADLPSPMPLVDTRTSPSPLSHSPSLSPFSAFKDTGHRGDSDLDSEVAAMFEEGFQKFIPPGSLVYKGSLVSSFTEQSFIQDRRNIDIAKGKKFANPKAVPPDPGWSGGTAAKVGMHRSASFPSTTHSSIAIAPTTGRRSITAVTPESPFSKDPRLMLNMPPRAAQRPLGDTSGLSPQQQQHGSMDYQQHQQHSHPIPQPYPTAPPLPPHPQSSTWSSGQGVMAGTSSDKSHMNTPMSADPVMERAAIGGRGHWPSQGYPRPPPDLHPHMPAVEGELQGSRNPLADPRLHKRQPNTGNGSSNSSSSGLVRGTYQPSPGHLGSPVNPLNALTAMATMDVKQEADMNAIHSVPSMPSSEAYVSPNTAQHSNLEQSPSLGRSLDTGAISTTNTTTTTTSISNQCSAVARPASPSPLQRQIPAGKVLQDTMMYGTPGINPCPKEGLFVDGEDEDLHCQRQQGLTDHSSVDTDTSIDSYSPSLLDKRLAALEAGLSDPCHDVDAEDSDHYDNKDWLDSDEEEEDEDVLEEEMSDDLVDEIVRCAPLKAKAIRSQESVQESTDQSTFLDPNTVNLKISNGFDKINNTRQAEIHWTPKSTYKHTSDEDLSQGTLPEETDSVQTSTAGTELTPTLIPVETQVSPPPTVSMPAPASSPACLPITTSLATPVSTHSSTEKPELHSDITPSTVEMPVTEADSMPEPALTPVIVSPHPQSQVPTPPSSSAVMIVPPSEESTLTVVTLVSTTAPGSHNQQQSCPPETPDQPLTTSLLHPLGNSESVQKEESDTESESDTETVPIKAETNNNCCDIVDLDSPVNSNVRAVKRPVKTIPMISMDRDGGKPGFLSGLDMDEPTDDIVPWPAYLHSLWSMSKRVGGCVPDFLPDTDVDLAKDCMGLLMTFTPYDMDLVNGDEYTEEGALAGALSYIMHTCHHTYTKEPETSQERDQRLIWQVGLHYLVPFQVHDERLISEADLAEYELESEVSSAQLSSDKQRVHKSRRGTTKYHPYIRPESPKESVSQKDKEEFFRIYTAHTDLHDLLQCLSRRNFASRKPYPGGILARNQQGPSAGLFTDYRFRRTSVQEIKDISCPRLRDAEDVHYTASEVTDLSSRRDAVQVLDGQVEEESKTKRKMAEDILGEEMEVYQSPSQDEESPKQGPARKTRKTDSENKGKIYDNLVLNTMTQATDNRDSLGDSGNENDLKISSLPEDNIIMGKSKKWRLVPVEVPQEDFTYNAAHYRELPELLETEILASRDPRLSPGLPACSVYSRTLFVDSDEDDLNSQHSEVCDSPRQLDDEGKSLKIRVHVNPKFFPNACEASEFMKAAEKSLSIDGRRSKKGSKQTEYQVKSHDDHVQPSHSIDRYIDQSGDISDDPEDDQEKMVTRNKSTCRYKMTSPDRSSAKEEVQALVRHEAGTEDKERPPNSISNDSGGGVMWDDIAAYDEDDTELEPVDSPLTGWRACPDLIYPMSRFVKSAMAAASRKEPWNKFEDIVECGMIELGNELERVMKGDASVPVCSYKHLPSLSIDTQLYSSMIESQVIRMVHLQILKEWITRKPLDRLIAGKLDASKLKRPDPILQLSSITNTVKDCTDDFHCSVFKLASGKNSNKINGGVFKDVRSATEDTVEDVYGQVHLYMEFLLDKVTEKFQSLSNIHGHGTTRHRPDKLQLRTSSKEQIHKSHIPIKRKYESPDEITRSEHMNACHLPKLNMAVTVKNETVDNSMRAAMVDFKQDLDRVAIGPVVKMDSSNLTKRIKPEANSRRSSPKRICPERDDSIYSPYSPSYPTEREDLQETLTCDKAVIIEENKSLESKKKKRSRDERDKKQEREKKEKVEKRGKEGKESKVGLREKQLEADPSPDPSDRRRRREKDVDRGSKYRDSSMKSNNSSDKRTSTAEISGVATIDKQLAQFKEEHVQKTTETSGATEKPTKRRTYSERSLPDTDTNLTRHPHPKKSRFEMQCEASKAKANDMMKEILKQLHSKSFYVDAHLSDCSDLYSTEGLLPNFSVHFDPGVPPCEKSSNPSVLSWAFFNHFVHKFDNLFTRLWESPEDKNLFQSQVEEQVDIFLWALLLSYQEQYPKDNHNSASLSHMSSSQTAPSQCEQSTNEYGSVKNTDRCGDAMEITNEYGSTDLANEYGLADSTNEYGSSTDVNQTESSCGDGNQDHTTSVIADSLSEEGELLDGKGLDTKKGRGSKLLMAFKQAIEAKKRKPDDKSKPTPFKLNPVLAAKRAAPKHSKPLFKPSQIYEASAETDGALKSSLYSGEKQTHVCLSIHKSIDMDSLLKQALAMFSAQARDYVLERIGADALNQLVAGILPSMHTTGIEKTDSNLLVYLLDLLYKERANSSQKTKDAQLALLKSSEEECHDTNKQPDSIGKVNLSSDFKSFGSSGSTSSLRVAVGTANKSHKEDAISCIHASPPVKEPTPEVEAPVFNVDTEHKKNDDSKPVLPKGDKFMAAFRQAMIAKKRAHKEGQAVGKYATSMSKISTTTTMARTKPSSIITTAEEDEASSKIMEALTSFSNSTTKTLLPPKLSDAMASDSVVRSIPTIGSVSRTESTVPEPMEEDSDPGEDNAISTGDNATLSYPSSSEIYSSQPVLYSSASNVSQQEAVSVFSAPPYYSTEATASVASNPHPNSSAEDSSKSSLPSQASGIPLPGIGHSAPPPLPTVPPPASQPPEPPPPTYYQTPSAALPSTVASMHDEQMMQHYKQQIEAWQQNRQLPQPYPPPAAYTCPPQPPWPGYGPPIPHRPPLLPSPVAGAAPPQPPNTTAPTPHYNSPPPPPGAEPPPPGSWSSWPPPPGVSPQWPESSWGTGSWSQPS